MTTAPDDTTARLATADDLATIVQLVEAEIEQKRDLRGGSVYLRREVRDVLSGLPGWVEAGRVVTGVFAGVVLGAAAFTIETLADGENLARIEVLVTDPEARKVGIGEAMMNEVVARARAAGCEGLDATALPGDRETKNFFESFGLKARLLIVHRDL